MRGESVGWDDATLKTIASDDPLVLRLLGSGETIAVRTVSFGEDALPAEDRRPSFAMPTLIRSKLEAIVFYGPHASQEELAPVEMETLDRLLTDASAAYDHVRAEMAAQRVSDLEAQVARLRTLRVVS